MVSLGGVQAPGRRLADPQYTVENAADDILHTALAELFAKEKNAIEVIKWKDIYETMEKVTDRLEDVANVLQGVIVKMS